MQNLPPLGTYIDVTAESMLHHQDPKGLVMAFFHHSDRVRIHDMRVEGLDYRAGTVMIPKLQPITVRPYIPEWTIYDAPSDRDYYEQFNPTPPEPEEDDQEVA